MVDFHRGRATKPSLLAPRAEERLAPLLYRQDAARETGCSLHVIDSERASDDISLSDYARLLEYAEELGDGPVAVLTLPVRRSDFEERFREALEILSGHGRGGLCLVAGNPAYLSEDEASRPPGRMLLESAARARERMGDGLLMMGTENVRRYAAEAARKWRLTPFILLDRLVEEEVRWFSRLSPAPIAIYAPLMLGERADPAAEEKLLAYALRRKRIQELLRNGEARPDPRGLISHVALLGSLDGAARRLRQLREAGASMIVGLPLGDERVQLEMLRRTVDGCHG